MWRMGLIIFWLGILAVMDIRQRRVPVCLLAVGGVFAVITAAYSCFNGTTQGVEMLWGLIPGGFLLLVAAATQKAGWADGIVLLTLGMLLDHQACTVSFAISLFLISVVSLLLLVFRRIGRNARLPYLPFLWAGCLFQAVTGFSAR